MMDLKSLLHDEDAVSPVIGVILMVAITVILAAVIASFVLGLGDSQQVTPQASFEFDYTPSSDPDGAGDTLEITHTGGDTIDGDRLSASVSGADDGSSGDVNYDGDLFSSGEVSSGVSSTIDATDGADFETTGSSPSSTDADLDAATVRIIYTSQSGDDSATLTTWEGPSA